MKRVNVWSFIFIAIFALPMKLIAQSNDQEIINNLELIENVDLLDQVPVEMNLEEMPKVTNDDDFVDAPKVLPKGKSGNLSEENK